MQVDRLGDQPLLFLSLVCHHESHLGVLYRSASLSPESPRLHPQCFSRGIQENYKARPEKDKERCERAIHRKERHQLALDKQRKEEDERYREEVREEVMGRMERLRAKGDCL